MDMSVKLNAAYAATVAQQAATPSTPAPAAPVAATEDDDPAGVGFLLGLMIARR